MRRSLMPYLLLAIAIGSEIVATTFLKYSEGFSRLIPTLICAVFYLICHVTFGKTVMKLNLGMAYAIWCGVGIVVTTLISAVIFREKISASGFFGIVCIIVGCVILNMNGTGQ